MPTKPDQSYALAEKQAKRPDVARLFHELAVRAETYAQMQDEFLEGIIRHREARTGKPFRNTKRQQQFLDCADRDATQAEGDVAALTAKMDDKTLLIVTLTGEHQQLQFEEGMLPSYRPEDSDMAQRLVEFRRENIRIIERFVEASPFKGQIVSLWHGKKKSKTV